MAKNRKQLIHLHTPEVRMPEKDLLNLGEIAVQHNDTEAALYIQKNNGDIAKFIDATAVDAKIEVEKRRAEGAEGTLNGKIETLTSAVTDNEKVVATALNQIVKSVGLDENGNSPLPKNASLTDAIKDVTNKVSTLESSNHTHANKTVLDGITTEKVNAWNSAKADAISSAKTYVDSLNTAMDSRVDVLETSSHTHANKTVLNGITKEKVTAWDTAKADAISSAKTYTDSAITALNLASTYEAKGTAQNLINGLNLAETYAKKEVESTISTLVGKDTGKSVRSVSAEEVAKIVNSADTRYDTLKEIADWIISDTTGSAQMANDISALKAISAGTRLVKLENVSHSHSNKDLLDTYTQTESDLADAVTKRHAHTNKDVLDGITDVKVAAWDAAEANASAYTDAAIVALDLANTYEAKGAAADAFASAKTYTDGLDTAMGTRVSALEGDIHTHDNKTVLDDITTVKVAAWDAAEANAKKDAADKYQVKGNYETAGAAAQALIDAKAYTDEKLIKIDCGTY